MIKNKKKKFIILGAGPVGLVTGLFLSKQKFNVQIYEMKNQVGGMCRSWKWHKFYVDTGPHIFHTSDTKLWKLWKNIFKKNLIEGIYCSKNVFGDNFDNYIDYPLSKQSVNKLPKKLKSSVLNELKNIKVSSFSNGFAISFNNHLSSPCSS